MSFIKPFNVSAFISKLFIWYQKLSVCISSISIYMSSQQTGLGSLKLAAKLTRQFQNWQLKVALSKQCSPGWCCTGVSPLLVPILGLASSTGSRAGGSTPWLPSSPSLQSACPPGLTPNPAHPATPSCPSQTN